MKVVEFLVEMGVKVFCGGVFKLRMSLYFF